jgi:putative peptide zinc metalloprotease protein
LLAMPRQQDLPGTLVREGDTVGYILAAGELEVRAAVPEYDAALVRGRTRRAEVFLAEAPDQALEAQLVRETPAATHELPSAALGNLGGGDFVTDPADEHGLRSLDPLVLVDLTLPAAGLQRLGGRAWVRFDHAAEPLGNRWLRRGWQLFLHDFDPAT